MQEAAEPSRRKGGRPRGVRVHLKPLTVYEATFDQVRSAADAHHRSIAKEMQALFSRGPGQESLNLLASLPEDDLAACAQLIELVGNDRIGREEAQRAVTRFITSPLGQAIRLAAADITSRKVVDGFARVMGCTRSEAFSWWIELLKVVLPHIHQDYAAQPAGSAVSGGDFDDDCSGGGPLMTS